MKFPNGNLVFLLLIGFSILVFHRAIGENEGRANRNPKTVESLYEAFTRGLLPDLEDPAQVELFLFYKTARFGDATARLPTDYLQRIVDFQEQYPDFKQPSFQEVSYKKFIYEYPKFDKIPSGKTFEKLRRNVALMQDQIRDLAFGRVDKLVSAGKLTHNDVKEIAKVRNKYSWRKEALTVSNLEQLFDLLLSLRSKKLDKEESTHFVDQVLVNIANVSGFEDVSVREILTDRNANSFEKVKALKRAFDHREEFIVDMKSFVRQENQIAETYQGFLKKLGIRRAKKLPADAQLASQLQQLGTEIFKKRKLLRTERVRARQLSEVEKPIRSCLGGKRECSSRTYFERALEPHYIYFTETDAKFFSDGQVTLVLGETEGKKVAMVDKIQNVDREQLASFLEAVRKSMQRAGYRLAIPEHFGLQEGLTNEAATREALSELPAYARSETSLNGFTPEREPVTQNAHSRAYEKLVLRELLPLDSKQYHRYQMKLGKSYPAVTMKQGSIRRFLPELERLRQSSHEAKRLEYVRIIGVLSRLGKSADSQFEQVAHAWLKEQQTSQKLKNEILRQQLDRVKSRLDQEPTKLDTWNKFVEMVGELSGAERKTFIQNLKQEAYDFGSLIFDPQFTQSKKAFDLVVEIANAKRLTRSVVHRQLGFESVIYFRRKQNPFFVETISAIQEYLEKDPNGVFEFRKKVHKEFLRLARNNPHKLLNAEDNFENIEDLAHFLNQNPTLSEPFAEIIQTMGKEVSLFSVGAEQLSARLVFARAFSWMKKLTPEAFNAIGKLLQSEATLTDFAKELMNVFEPENLAIEVIELEPAQQALASVLEHGKSSEIRDWVRKLFLEKAELIDPSEGVVKALLVDIQRDKNRPRREQTLRLAQELFELDSASFAVMSEQWLSGLSPLTKQSATAKLLRDEIKSRCRGFFRRIVGWIKG